jgi:hypothetical protein
MDTSADNITHSEAILNERLAPGTKRQYAAKVVHFEEWISHVHPELVEEDADSDTGYSIAYGEIGVDVMKEFLGHISKKQNRKAATPEQPYVYFDPIKLQSVQHVNGYKSALVNKYRTLGIALDFEHQTMFSDMLTGYRRVVQKKKQDGEMDMHEGKYPLSFSGYRYLAKKAMAQTTDFPLAVFAHIFLLLCWNLIARCVSVSSIMFQHISWEEDAMVIVFPTTKSDKTGKNSAPIHVFANPTSPEICPILWLGVFIWCSGFRRSGAKAVLFGPPKETEKRFSDWLHGVLGSSAADLLLMGIIILEIGTHSFRKGVANFLAGLAGGPSAVAIYLRAGWSLGPVTSRYILEGQGNDQLCGRAATGLPITEIAFADLPPHFDLSDGEILTVSQWEEILPGYSTYYPQSFRQVLPFLLASVVHHREFLRATLAPEHPLFLSRLWTSGIIDTLAPKVYTGNGKHPVTKLTATGIPPHILLANELAATKGELETVRTTILQKLDEVPDRVKESMLENFQVDGAVPITVSQVTSMMSEMQQRLVYAIVEQGARQHTALVQVQSSLQPAAPPTHTDFTTYTWGEGLHTVPEFFRFPK